MSWKAGVWAVICDRCGFEYKSNEVKRTWDKLIVCKSCWEPRHPLDYIRARKEESNKLPFTRPEPPPQFINVPYITVYIDPDYIENQGLDTYFEES
jgi:hypothetical protein